MTETLEVLSMAALTLTTFLCAIFLIAVGLGMISSYYMRTRSPRLED